MWGALRKGAVRRGRCVASSVDDEKRREVNLLGNSEWLTSVERRR